MKIEELLCELEPVIMAKAKRAYVPGLDWQDIAQEFRILVFRKQHYFLNGKSSIKTFANTAFRNKLIDIHKSAERKRFEDIDEYEEKLVCELQTEEIHTRAEEYIFLKQLRQEHECQRII